jgi:hypothetical protein
MKKQIVDPRLPGRYGRMSAQELDAEVARFDHEIRHDEIKPLTPAMKASLRKAKTRGGRPQSRRGSRRVSITVEQELLDRADRYAKSNSLSRSELIAKGLESIIGSAA